MAPLDPLRRLWQLIKPPVPPAQSHLAWRQLRGVTEVHLAATEPADMLRVALLYVLIYGPGENETARFRRTKEQFRQLYGDQPSLAHALEDRFYEDLYVNRPELGRLKELIDLHEIITVVGLAGCGKTVLLRKLARDLRAQSSGAVVYFDLNICEELSSAAAHDADATAPTYLAQSRYVANVIQQEYLSTPLSTQLAFYAYLIAEDPAFVWMKQRLQARYGVDVFPTSDLSAWAADGALADLWGPNVPPPSLEAIGGYLAARYGRVVVILDNVDRRRIAVRRAMLQFARYLVTTLRATVFVAMRDLSLRETMRGAQLGGPRVAEPVAPLQLVPGLPSRLHVDRLGVRRLLQRRIRFLRQAPECAFVRNRINSLAAADGFNPLPLEKQWRRLLSHLVLVITEQEAYQYGNDSIREVMILYYRLCDKLLRRPDPLFVPAQLAGMHPARASQKLRTFYYRWVIAAGARVPPHADRWMNILASQEERLSLQEVHILEILSRQYSRDKAGWMTLAQLADVFSCFGVTEGTLRERLDYLRFMRVYEELGCVAVDGDLRKDAKEHCFIAMNPAGEYFLDRVGVSCEYLFWCAIHTPLPFPVVGGAFTVDDTYADAFRLRVVLKLIRGYLVPMLRRELDYFDKELRRPGHWKRSNREFYVNTFGKKGRVYVNHAISAITAYCRKAEVDEPTRSDLLMGFDEQLAIVQRLEACDRNA